MTPASRKITIVEVRKTSPGADDPPRRICLLDLVRGTAVLLMFIFHFFYTFGFVLRFPFFLRVYLAVEPYAPPVISCLFIFTCAYSCRLSESNFRRGLQIFAVAVGLSLVTCLLLPLFGLRDEGIWFGVLHFLGIAVMLARPIEWLVRRIPFWLGAPLLIALAVGTREMMVRGFFGIPITYPPGLPNLLFPFGLYNESFYSADYYPLFPWLFVFALACLTVRRLPVDDLPAFATRRLCPPIEFLGRHSLLLYVVHQPVIFALGELIRLLM